MTAHLEQPGQRGSVDGVHTPERATRNDLLYFLKVTAIFDLVRNGCLHAGLAADVRDLRRLVERGSHRFFVGNQFHAMLYAQTNQRQPHRRRSAKAEDIRLGLA